MERLISPSGEQGPPVLRVSELTAGLRLLVEEAFEDVCIEGELSNFKRHTSGHCYFTLKDADAQLRGVMWRAFAQHVYFQPQDGMLVRVRGQISVYEQRGDLQVVARSMQLAGEGALQKSFEALKRKLAAEGLFDAARKRALPVFPECVGVVTSGTGAALQDILTILGRRFPQVRVLVCPVQVQGLGAAESVAEAVDAFSTLEPGDPLRPDLLIVGRGGGSIEDLWAFNEEIVARAIHASSIPVISAVGHETDFTIADFVADVRAATPSMAAEMAVPDRRQVAAVVHTLHDTLAESVLTRIREHRQHVRSLTGSFGFRRPLDQLARQGERLAELRARLHRAAARSIAERRRGAEALQGRLSLLDPVAPLRRGYARVERDGGVVRSAKALAGGERVALRIHDGTRRARIEPEPRDDGHETFNLD